MTRIAFFGHDAGDAAIRRRVRVMRDGGLDVCGFMMRRCDNVLVEWENVDLGRTRDGAFLQRMARVFSGARIAAKARDKLALADVIYARNLDMLACAFLARRHAKLETPVIYESLDVHRLLTREDFVGRILRRLERSLLRRTTGLIVSSPGFLRNHFEKHYAGLFRAFVVENRLAAGSSFGPRPEPSKPCRGSEVQATKLRLGWVGILRCKRSFDLLCELADAYPDTLEIKLHGRPARTEIKIFEPEIAARQNMTFHGSYRSPEDLVEIYDGLDLVWAGDFMEAGYNSSWLLPNRLYEGGYFATPSLAPSGTETAAWIERHACGMTLDEPLEKTLPMAVGDLIANRSLLETCRNRLLAMPDEVFIEPKEYFSEVVERALAGARSE
jgi:succinoglycan biosynthesis protein ExoL